MSSSTLLIPPSRRSRTPRRAAAPGRIRTGLPAGICFRELRAGLPTVAALAIVIVLAALLEHLGATHPQLRQNIWLPTAVNIENIWKITLIAAFFLMGILCGAEEAENGTADFARRLPVPRLHIYLAKNAGALGCVLLWVVLSVLVIDFIFWLDWHALYWPRFHGHSMDWHRYFPRWSDEELRKFLAAHPDQSRPFWGPGGMRFMPVDETWRSLLAWGFLFFFTAQAAGVWIERVIVGALVGGLTAAVYGWVALGFATGFDTRNLTHWPLIPFLAGALVALVAAFIRFQTREGR